MKKNKRKFSFLKYLKKYIPLVIINILLSIAIYGLSFYASILGAKSLEAVTDGDLHLMLKYVLFVTGINAGITLINFPLEFIYKYVTSHVYVDMKSDLTARLFEISAESYGESGASAFVQRVLNDPSNVFSVFTSIFDLLLSSITEIAVIIYILSFNVYIGLFIFGVALIVFTYDFFRNRWRKKKNLELRELNDEVYSYTNEIVRSQLDIKALNLEDSLKSTVIEKHAKLNKKEFKFAISLTSLGMIRSFFIYVSVFLLLYLSVFVYENLALPMTAFLYIYQNRNIFVRLANNINNMQNQLVNFYISRDRIYELYEEDKFPTEKFGGEVIENCRGEVEFKNVSFSYKIFEKQKEGRKDRKKAPAVIDRKQVLKEINFKINAGENVAFVGRSGAGKSTIVSLIPKLYECDEGEILIDGKDVKKLNKNCLRENISLVNQSPYIFNLSIRDNLLLSKKDATEPELIAALEQASLYDFVQGLDKGIDTIVGENGVKLSGGQKQRLAIARALLKESKIIIFDESTSSLDNFAQEDVKNAIAALSGGRTVITVAHRLSTIKSAEKIFFVDDGKIVAAGNFEQLISSCDEFASLFSVETI